MGFCYRRPPAQRRNLEISRSLYPGMRFVCLESECASSNDLKRDFRQPPFVLSAKLHLPTFHLFDIIVALQGLRQLDKCAILEIPQANRYSATLDDEYHEDEINIRFALALCFVGDMPQQQANVGVMSKLSI